jgi:hypothetical protein
MPTATRYQGPSMAKRKPPSNGKQHRFSAPYSSKIIKAGALIGDTKTLLSHWDASAPVAENIDRIQRDNVFGKASRSRVEDILAIFRQRYLAEECVTKSLVSLVRGRLPAAAGDTQASGPTLVSRLATPIGRVAKTPVDASEKMKRSHRDPDNYFRSVRLYSLKLQGLTNKDILSQLWERGQKFNPSSTDNALRSAIDWWSHCIATFSSRLNFKARLLLKSPVRCRIDERRYTTYEHYDITQ